MYAALVPALLFNTLLAKLLSKVEGALGFLHLALYPCILVPLVYFAPHGTASEAFGDFLKGGGYGSDGLTFFAGTIGTVFAFVSKCMGSIDCFYPRISYPSHGDTQATSIHSTRLQTDRT